jgi:hypothetical protein
VGVGSAKNVLDLRLLASSCRPFGANHVQNSEVIYRSTTSRYGLRSDFEPDV